MDEHDAARADQLTESIAQERGLSRQPSGQWAALPGCPAPQSRWLFRTFWLAINGLLVLSVLLAMCAAVWEYSTRRYLTGFSDAIIPATAPGEEKIEAILNWMSHGPARRTSIPSGFMPERNPTDTLNYYALLKVCGTATNAFINLLNTGNIEVRRLLLLDSRQLTEHVVAEVLVDNRWIVVDPAYRVVMRTPDGKALTSKELRDPLIWAEATQGIPHYDPAYTFNNTAHIHTARLHFIGTLLQRILDHVAPGWDASPVMTLLVERESFAAMISSLLLVLFLLLLRIAIRWYGERRLGIQSTRIRGQLRRLYDALLHTSA
ncbi:MAG: hypothetical protein WCC97_07420 [Candidatus Acidiferrales bacterium]